MSAFFCHIRRKRSSALVYKYLRNLESGVFHIPKSFDLFSKYRTEELKLNHTGDTLCVAFPENALILAFYRKYPQIKSRPLALSSFDAPIAKQFALKQLQLMNEEKLSADTAFERVEKDMMPQIMQFTRPSMGSSVSAVQLAQTDEERSLKEALAAVAEGKAPVNMKQSSRGFAGEATSLQFGVEQKRRRVKESD
ncbi:hypothetical protein CEUSTIGMA_g10434.t1 [Chlamydomonas eustigma]|uniref:Uncharacterized protein n=1 Tax=Chlamydomonas eustigma TaxID=1157962 RepID=A0A250XIV2_9CHLO|nr:hypothetical protein CEUSTIGMA_g10434.t1 [Chlamydomonas eustigma]|eukprot:GAX83007.1 hypothetical protein CEUSTIGMA_g10434.t1 [Chlamydomonas eustigma]